MSGIATAAGMLATKYVLSAQQQVTKVLLQYTTVRYRRKPRWLGTAKSKLFRVPERKKYPEEEVAELKRLHNNYHTQMKAVRSFLMNEVEAFKLVSRAGMVIHTPEEEAAEWEQIQRINEEWNKHIAAIREERLTKEREQRNEYILERLAAKEQRDLDKLKVIEDRVRYEKEQAVNFITRTNIDKAIEMALVQPTSYNFAIDTNGNIHKSDGGEGSEDKLTSPQH